MLCFYAATIVVGVVVCTVWWKALKLQPAPFFATLFVFVVASVVVEVVATVVKCVVAADAVVVPLVLLVVVAVVVTLAVVAEVAEDVVPGAKFHITPDAPSTRHPRWGLKAVILALPAGGFVRGTPHRPASPYHPFRQTCEGHVRPLANLLVECSL